MSIFYHHNDDNDKSIPSKFILQKKIFQLQNESSTLFNSATSAKLEGDLKSASQLYESFQTVEKEHIKLELLLNKYYPDTAVDVRSTVRSLVENMILLADIFQSMNNLQGAENLRNEAKTICKQHLSVCDLADIERSIASSLTYIGRFVEVLVTLERCRDIFKSEKCNDSIKLVETTINLASIREWLGDYSRALSDLEIAEEKMVDVVQNKTIEQLWKEGLVLAIRLEQLEQATDLDLVEIQTILKNIKDNSTFRQIFNLIYFYKGNIHKLLGEFDQAEFYFTPLIKYAPKIQIKFDSKLINLPIIKLLVASILIGKQKYQEGLAYANQIEQAVRTNADLRPKLAALVKNQSEGLLKLGRTNEALEKLETAIEDLTVSYYDPDTLWKLLWLKAQGLESINDKKKALESYLQAAEIVNGLRKAPLGYRLDSTYLKDKIELFQSAIILCSKMGFPEKCCEFMEMIKSRTLTAILSIRPLTSINEIQRELKGQFDNLTLRLESWDYIHREKKLTKDEQETKKALWTEREEIMERIMHSDPRWKTITRPIPFDLSKIIKIIADKKQAVLNLFYISHPNQETFDTIVVVLIQEGNCEIAELSVSADIKNKLNEYQRNLQTDNPSLHLFDISTAFSLTAEDLIPSNILYKALTAEELIIIPHRILHLIPWSGLISKGGKRLFEYCPVGILPNLSCILKLSTSTPPNKPRVALIGSPDYKDKLGEDRQLFGATLEMKLIEDIYPSKNNIIGKPLLGSEVTEENFWKLLNHNDSNGGILHIICHGRFEPEEPMSSGLFLTNSKVDAAEIAQSSLKYDEVILSACSTGMRSMNIGNIKLFGDDIIGLPGSFLEAGIKSVLVSIPQASDDVTPYFMELYHKNRINNKRPLVALREAQKTMLDQSIDPPFNWIGFVIYGC
jgi:CHAT domain-containing protein